MTSAPSKERSPALFTAIGLVGAALLYRVASAALGAYPYDLPSFYFGARLAFVEGVSPYGAEAFAEASRWVGSYVFPYIYAPPSLLTFWPFAALSPDGARTAMVVVNVVATFVFLALTVRKILPHALGRPLGPLELALAVVFPLAFHPTVVTFEAGQVNLIVLALIGCPGSCAVAVGCCS